MFLDLKANSIVTAATAAFIQNKDDLRLHPERIESAAETLEADDFDEAAYAKTCEAQAREEEFARPEFRVAEMLEEHEAIDVTDDRYGVDCGKKKDRTPSLEDIDEAGWVPRML